MPKGIMDRTGEPTAQAGGVIPRWVTQPFKAWRLTIVRPMAVAVGVALVSLLLPEEFRARASFYPSAPPTGLPSNLSSVAATLGISGGLQTQGPDFYANLLRSQSVLSSLASTALPVASGDPVTPVEAFEYHDLPSAEALDKTRSAL